MDGLILITTILFVFFFGIALKAYYDYVIEKKELKTYVKEVATTSPELNEQSNLSKDKLISKLFHYADDFSSLGHRINFFSESDDVRKWLMQGGYPHNLNVDRFQGLKIFLGLIGLILSVIFIILQFPFALLSVVLLPLIGYLSAVYWLKGKAKSRQEEISYMLPDFLDTVSVTLQAGLSLDQALREIVPYFEGALKEEFTRLDQRISLGVTREEAYYEILKRNDSHELQTLIKSLIQGSQLGVPVATTFKVQAEEMRKLKKENIKEKAAKASPKISLITTFIVMPTAMILIGGLMVLNLFFGDDSILRLFD